MYYTIWNFIGFVGGVAALMIAAIVVCYVLARLVAVAWHKTRREYETDYYYPSDNAPLDKDNHNDTDDQSDHSTTTEEENL